MREVVSGLCKDMRKCKRNLTELSSLERQEKLYEYSVRVAQRDEFPQLLTWYIRAKRLDLAPRLDFLTISERPNRPP